MLFRRSWLVRSISKTVFQCLPYGRHNVLLWSTKLREILTMVIKTMLGNVTWAWVNRVFMHTWNTMCILPRTIPDRYKCPKPTYPINIWGKRSSIIQLKDVDIPVRTRMQKCWCSLQATSVDWEDPETMDAYKLLDLLCLEDFSSSHLPSLRSSFGSYYSSSVPSSCSHRSNNSGTEPLVCLPLSKAFHQALQLSECCLFVQPTRYEA